VRAALRRDGAEQGRLAARPGAQVEPGLVGAVQRRIEQERTAK